MAVRIRLKRMGAKKRPYASGYRVARNLPIRSDICWRVRVCCILSRA